MGLRADPEALATCKDHDVAPSGEVTTEASLVEDCDVLKSL
jgi:hypothetical protein